jgi:hypothetical protein
MGQKILTIRMGTEYNWVARKILQSIENLCKP